MDVVREEWAEEAAHAASPPRKSGLLHSYVSVLYVVVSPLKISQKGDAKALVKLILAIIMVVVMI